MDIIFGKINLKQYNNSSVLIEYAYQKTTNSLSINVKDTSSLMIFDKDIENIISDLTKESIVIKVLYIKDISTNKMHISCSIPKIVLHNCKIIKLNIFSDISDQEFHIIDLSLDSFNLTSRNDVKGLFLSDTSITNHFEYLVLQNTDTLYISNCMIDSTVDFSNGEFSSFILENTTFQKLVKINDLNISYLFDLSNIYCKQVPMISLNKKMIALGTVETIRYIKELKERTYNKIEANKYHALELSKRREELNKEFIETWQEIQNKETRSSAIKPFLDNLQDWIIFNFHEITSKHSQSWILPIYWIIFFAMFASTFIKPYDSTIIHLLATGAVSFLFYKLRYFKKHMYYQQIFYLVPFLTISIIHFLTLGFNFCEFFTYLEYSYKLNTKYLHGFHYVFNKAIIAYLTYQFILGVRKDTRR